MLSYLGFPARFPSGAPYFRRALILFWTLDALMIAAFIIARFMVFFGVIAFVPRWLGIATEYSAPESMNYFKWFVCVLCLAVAWFRFRVSIFACLAILFAMVFADDLFLGHETFGQMLHDAINIPPTLGIDGKQIGEMVIFGCMGVIALLLLALGYRYSPKAFRSFAHLYLIVVFLLGHHGRPVRRHPPYGQQHAEQPQRDLDAIGADPHRGWRRDDSGLAFSGLCGWGRLHNRQG